MRLLLSRLKEQNIHYVPLTSLLLSLYTFTLGCLCALLHPLPLVCHPFSFLISQSLFHRCPSQLADSAAGTCMYNCMYTNFYIAPAVPLTYNTFELLGAIIQVVLINWANY